MRSRFVRPETRRLELSEGDWLLVKRRLSAGEERAAFARQYTTTDDGTVRVNPLTVPVARILAYLLDWSFVDDDGKRVVIFGQPLATVESALDQLESEDFAEVREAIERHEVAMREEREAQKKTRTGAMGSPPTLPSLVAVAGATNG